jgi:hypothetical protein
MAVDAENTPGPTMPNANSAAIGPTDTASPTTPAMMALPADTGSSGSDASTHRKFYTFTASLREIYDDNVNTTSTNPQTSLETELSPSILVDFPMDNTDFSARYTFDITYYSNSAAVTGGSTGSNGGSLQYTQEFVAQYMHSFSSRFSLALADQFREYTEPSIFESTGTAYNNGTYDANTFNGTLNAQWTPLFGTTTTYSNTIVKYDNAAVAVDQNSMENTGSQNFSFAVLPKISVGFGGIGDNITYDTADRGYTSYTGFFSAQWQALPSVSVSGRGGGSYTETVQSQGMFSPYAALSLSWGLGARSALSFDYAHEITPSYQVGANGQTSDRFSGNFSYVITPRLSSHLQGTYTNATISQQLSVAGAGNSYNEGEYALDTGLTYQYNSYLDINWGITLSGVTAETNGNDYSRQEAYFGVRGTY